MSLRTSVDLPTELLHAAKVRATARGERLKELFIRAVAQEVGLPTERRGDRRVVLPLVGGGEPTVGVTNADIEAALAAEDAERYGGR